MDRFTRRVVAVTGAGLLLAGGVVGLHQTTTNALSPASPSAPLVPQSPPTDVEPQLAALNATIDRLLGQIETLEAKVAATPSAAPSVAPTTAAPEPAPEPPRAPTATARAPRATATAAPATKPRANEDSHSDDHGHSDDD